MPFFKFFADTGGGGGGAQGPQGYQGPANIANDIFAATRVVDPGGAGTDTTIAAAISNLPAAGGKIFIKQGTYSIAATLTLPNKSVEIIGAGVESTIIDIGSNAIAAFTMPSDNNYDFRDFTIVGDGSAGQKAFDHTAAGGVARPIHISRANVGYWNGANPIERIVVAASGNIKFYIKDSQFSIPTGVAAAKFLEDTSPTSAVFAECTRVRAWGGGGVSGWGNLILRDCEINAENGISTMFLETLGGDVITGGGLVSVTTTARIINTSFGGLGTEVQLLSLTGSRHFISGCTFTGFTNEAILVGAIDSVFVGNYAPGVLPLITETGGANNNLYSNNQNIQGSLIIGTSSIVTDWNTRLVNTSPVTLDEKHRTVLVDATGGARVINLPAAVLCRYRTYQIKKIDSSTNLVTIDPNGGETIDGRLTLSIAVQYHEVSVQSNGSSWSVVGRADPQAATLVVDATGNGDFATIAGAIAALPAAGGKIFVRQGTYSLGATLTMPDKDVEIEGAGDGTVLSLGANAIAAITIPNGLTAVRRYSFKGMKITGTDVASQIGVQISDANARGYVTLSQVDTTGIQIPIDITNGDPGYTIPVEVMAEDCYFEPLVGGTSILVQNASGYITSAHLRRVGFYYNHDPLNAVGGVLTDDYSVDFWIEDSIISLTGTPQQVGAIIASGTDFVNWGAGFTTIWFFGSATATRDTCFTGCTFQSLKLMLYENFTIDGGRLSNVWVDPYSYEAVIENCNFEMGANNPIGITNTGATLCKVNGVYFDLGSAGAVTNYYIESSMNSTLIENCWFEPLGGAGVAAVHLTSDMNTVIGCVFQGGTLPPIIDDAGRNNFSGNTYYELTQLPTINSYGQYYSHTSSNGMGHHQLTAQTETGVFAQDFFIATGSFGVMGIGTIKNVGAQTLEVREDVTDFWGVSSSATTTLLAGNTYMLDMQTNIGTGLPPYKRYAIRVRHLGTASNFDLRISATGCDTVEWPT